jgi:Tol biopolymer transport system component
LLGNSPTMTSPARLRQCVGGANTEVGVILGTAAYMAPEQARGAAVDKRADIWAFGVVLFEMLTAKTCFAGKTVTDVLAAVVKTEPDWNALPAGTPRRVRALLRRCLAKDRRQRLRDIGDAQLELEDVLAGGSGPARDDATVQPVARRPDVLPWGVTAVAVIAAGLAWWSARAQTPVDAPIPPRARLSVQLPGDIHVAVGSGQPALALSPDGRVLVFVGELGGRTQLYRRSLDEEGVHAIPGTEGGYSPFFSPDGAWVGYFDRGVLKEIAPQGGSPITLQVTTPVTLGASWSTKRTVVVGVGPETGLGLASVSGEKRRPFSALIELTSPDYGNGEQNHSWPSLLPDGRHVIFVIRNGPRADDGRVAVASLHDGDNPLPVSTRTLALSGASPIYSDGHLLFVRDGRLLAVPFDVTSLEPSGNPIELAAGVMIESTGGVQLAVASRGGGVVYVQGETVPTERDLVWVDRLGRRKPLTGHGTFLFGPRLSPDDGRVAYAITDASNTDLWVFDVARGTPSRLTQHQGEDYGPVWSPNGTQLAFASEIGQDEGEKGPVLAWMAADRTKAPERFPLRTPTSGEWDTPTSWMRDGSLVFNGMRVATGYDVYRLPPGGDRRPVPLANSTFGEYGGEVSPDGRWFAYVSDETGQEQVYVRPFDGGGGPTRISANGGAEPCWSRKGDELFFRDGEKMMAVSVLPGTTFKAGVPQTLFTGDFDLCPWPGAGPRNYDVALDGRFVMVARKTDARPQVIRWLLNWRDALRQVETRQRGVR